jgi:hypothetical protein
LKRFNLPSNIDLEFVGPEFKEEMREYYEWVTWLVKSEWGKDFDTLILNYAEPLSAYLSSVLAAPNLGLHANEKKLPQAYLDILQEFDIKKMILIFHTKDWEENRYAHDIFEELKDICKKRGIGLQPIIGDMWKLNFEVLDIASSRFKNLGIRSKTLFQNSQETLFSVPPLAMQVGAFCIRSTFDCWDDRVSEFIAKNGIERVMLTVAPDQILGKDLENWFYIPSGIREKYERLLGEGNVYRLWMNARVEEMSEEMRRNRSDASEHILWWAMGRAIAEAMARL